MAPPAPPPWPPAAPPTPPAPMALSTAGSVVVTPTPVVVAAPRRSRAPRAVGAVALVVVLLAGAAAVRTRVDRGPSSPKQWDARVADIAGFVQTQRGAAFRHPVPVVFMAPADFKRKMAGERAYTKSDEKQLDQSAAAMRALGLLSGPVNLRQATSKLDSEDVVGVYEPDQKKVFVRGTDLTPTVRATLAHELTHALQDQLFDLNKMERNPDADTAVRALVEADATRVENAYVDSLSDADHKAYDAAENADRAATDTSGVPDVLTHDLLFPYEFGPAFVNALLASGGTKTLDNAFRSPPRTEAEIVDPLRYLDHRTAADPPTPRPSPGERIVDQGPFGQVTMAEVLAPRIGFDAAWKALKGWQSDRSAIFEDKAGKVCASITTRLGDQGQTAAFKAAADQWAKAVKGTVAGVGADVTIRACDPGPAAKTAAPAGTDAYAVLAVRAQLIEGLLEDGHFTVDAAECMAATAATALGPDTMASLHGPSEPDDATTERVSDSLVSARDGCVDGTTVFN